MKVTVKQLENYLEATPPVIWAWVYTELREGEAKRSLHQTLFDETDHARDLAQPAVRREVIQLASRFPEIRDAVEICATNFYIRHSWRRWLPWNWGK